MNINSNDIEFLKQLKGKQVLVQNIINLSEQQIKYKIKKTNYILGLMKHSQIVIDDLGFIRFEEDIIKSLIRDFDGINFSKSHRLNSIVMFLLKDNFVKKVELEKYLCCSKSSIKNDFLELKSILKKFKINLKYIHRKGFSLAGKEERIRNFFLNYFMTNYNFFERNVLLKEAQLLMEDILKGINSSFETSKIISILLTIQYYRISYGNTITEDVSSIISPFKHRLKGENICTTKLMKISDILREEDLYLEVFLNNLIYDNIRVSSSKDLIFINSLDIFIQNVEKNLCLSLENDNKLRKGLYNHIQALLFKKNNHIPVNNDDFESFKREFSLLYKTVDQESRIFQNNFNVKFEQGDLIYISYHFLSAINRANKKKTKKILIVCNKGIGASKILEEKLKTLFYVDIVENLSFYEYKNQEIEEVDIIIHTIDMFKSKDSNIKVAPFLSKVDIERLESLGCLKK